MKNLSLINGTLGVLLLLSLMLFLPSYKLNSVSDLNNTSDNDKIYLSGKVIKQTRFGSSSLLGMDNGLEVQCSCKSSYKNKNVSIEGIIDDFSGKKRVVALKINSF